MALIRLRVCAGWSEPLLVAHTTLLEISSRGSYVTAFDGVGYQIRRGSFMGAHDLLNLLNKLRKNDNMRVLLNIFSLFRNELNTFNNTGTQMLHSIYHMPLKLLKITF